MNDQYTGQILANKYRLEAVLRDDDLGKIYQATHVSMDKPVTVKVLAPALAVDESIVRRFSAEARGVSQVSHPNILNVNDFGADNGAVYIVYEGASGGTTLKEAIRDEGKFSFDRAVAVARQIASALAAAHHAGMIHRNLSADNVLLSRTPSGAETVKVSGFGAALSNERELLGENNVQSSNIEYLSPEQCADTGAVDERSDVYGLGVILYEMLAGEVPFSGRTPTEIMLKSSAEPPAPLAAFRQDLPAEIEPIVLRAMAKNPEMRFHTMDEFVAALIRLSANAGAPEIVVAHAADAEPANNIWKTAFVVLAGISLLAIGLIYATSVKQTDPTTQMQTDANGQPVQPINPATGTDEQALSNLATMPAEIISNSNMMMMLPPGSTAPGGDGYNPWGGSGPPPGAPLPPPGNYVMIDPNTGSPFTTDTGVILVPVPANANVSANANVKPSPTPKGNAANANVAAPPATNTAPKPTPQATPDAKPATPAPKTERTPAKPTEQPKTSPPAASEKRAQSGNEQDSQ